eukprot:3813346-Rhodomonas_salina.1
MKVTCTVLVRNQTGSHHFQRENFAAADDQRWFYCHTDNLAGDPQNISGSVLLIEGLNRSRIMIQAMRVVAISRGRDRQVFSNLDRRATTSDHIGAMQTGSASSRWPKGGCELLKRFAAVGSCAVGTAWPTMTDLCT